MITKRAAYRGCLLGLAVGDAMGYPVDTKTWSQIQEDYGPYGLLGYDLVNGYADVSSHTQVAAFTCNGLLLGLTRGQVFGKMAPYVRYAALAQREWAIGQRRYDQPQQNRCWVFRISELRRRHCTDTRMVETLNRGNLGSLEEPVNPYDTPAAIGSAVAAGLFAAPDRMEPAEIARLGAECVALTHGSPLAFLPAAAAAYLVDACLDDSETPLEELVERTLVQMENQFGREYCQMREVAADVRQAVALARERNLPQQEAMEHLKCDDSAQVLAGAIYAALLCEQDFDSAMIVAVNHSGRSAAVSALAGAILGARMGEEALPEFYLESLELAPVLRELADDLVQGCPMERGGRMYDCDWDSKYLHGGA